MNKYTVELSLFIALSSGAVFFLGTLLLHLGFSETGYNFLEKDKRVELESGGSITQKFRAERPGLRGVKILLGDLDELGFQDRVELMLMTEDCATVLAQENITAFSPDPRIYYNFLFERQKNMIGQPYCLKVSLHSPVRKKERPYLVANDDVVFQNISYFDDTEGKTFLGRSLQIRPVYAHESFAANIQELENRLSQYKPGFVKGKILWFALSTLLVTGGWAYLLLRKDHA